MILGIEKIQQASFTLRYRQELSRTAAGQTRGKDLGPALWVAEYVSSPMPWSDVVAAEASIYALRGVVGTFEAHDARSPYPAAYIPGVDLSGAEVHSLSNGRIAFRGLPAGFTLRQGDKWAVGSNLHTIIDTVTANGSGVTPLTRVAPVLWPDVAVSNPVALIRPSCLMALDPDRMRTQQISVLHGTVAFSAVQVF